MILNLQRRQQINDATIGSISVDGKFCCFTLEDVVRTTGDKVNGATAIPAGQYQVIINHSQRFDRDMPLLLNVPDFSGIRIHAGNTAADTAGCILVGLNRTGSMITQSRLAFDMLFDMIKGEITAGDTVIIEIKDMLA